MAQDLAAAGTTLPGCVRRDGGNHRQWPFVTHAPRRPTGEQCPATTATPENPEKGSLTAFIAHFFGTYPDSWRAASCGVSAVDET